MSDCAVCFVAGVSAVILAGAVAWLALAAAAIGRRRREL